MAVETTAASGNAQTGTGTAVKDGELDTTSERPADDDGKPAHDDASATGKPSGEELVDGLNLKTLPKQYKDLQREYGKLTETMKEFESFGGANQVLAWTRYLSANPDFAQWVTQQKSKNSLGIDESQLDEQSKAALDTVRRIAKVVVDEEVGRIRQHEIAPLNEQAKQSLIAAHFDKMDSAYGDEWHEMRDMMSELSEGLPETMQDQPTFEDIEDLYFKALRRSGRLESYAASKLQKRIDEKKTKATDKPVSTGQNAPARAKSIAEAFEQAKTAR